MSIDTYSIRHADQRAIGSADQTELAAIRAGSAVADAGVRDEVLSGEIDDLEVSSDGDHDMERWNQQDVALDGEVGAVRDVVLKRAALLGDAYPFVIEGNSLQYRAEGSNGFYEYCLAICSAPSITKKPYVRLPRSFERVVSVLVKLHLGPSWRHFHTGAPRDLANGTNFLKSMRKLSEVTSGGREWRWDPHHNYPQKPTTTGDGGVDFVVWRPALDNRSGQIYVVGQCACGNDWPGKFNDISIPKLEKWFRPISSFPITKCFTTPFWLADGNLEIAHSEAGWVLDRARLTLMAYEARDSDEFRIWQPKLPQLFGLVAQAA